MKKIILILSAFLLVGCTNTLSSTLTIDGAIKVAVEDPVTSANTAGRGFKYYKPRDFALLEDNGLNHVLVSNGNKYYLNIDINGYYNKYKPTYTTNSNLFYSYKFNFNNNDGYIEIRNGNNAYFYIKMMYNYSYVEVAIEESGIKQAVINSAIILSSIRYNDKVIENLISSGDLDTKETSYQIKKPEKDESNKNILEVIDYSNYEEE